jgi:hypothetical protein
MVKVVVGGIDVNTVGDVDDLDIIISHNSAVIIIIYYSNVVVVITINVDVVVCKSVIDVVDFSDVGIINKSNIIIGDNKLGPNVVCIVYCIVVAVFVGDIGDVFVVSIFVILFQYRCNNKA